MGEDEDLFKKDSVASIVLIIILIVVMTVFKNKDNILSTL